MRTDEIHPGDLIAGKYRVRAILGRSHGLLLEGFHTEFDQRVVIKILLAGHGDEREIERFRREARTLAKLASEHVARIIDVGTEPDGSFYLVREYLEGMDLGSYVQQHGALPLVDAALTILMAAEAVAETHGHGIIVRELSPAHLFLTQRAGGAPLVKITDFGTAKLMRDAAAPGAAGDLTATAMFGLSPYSSPELLRKAKNVDVRTDVWSLGAIFYELLTGHPPFTGEAARLMLQITREEPLAATHLQPELPPEIESILGWCLAKDLDARFGSVHAFAESLRPYASAEGQVLIERIAQIDERARLRKRGGSAPPPAFPSARAAAPAPLPAPSVPPPAPLPAPSVPAAAPLPAPSVPPAAPLPAASPGSVPPPQAMSSAVASPPAPAPLPLPVPSLPAAMPAPPPARATEESVTDVRPLPGPPAVVPSFVPAAATQARSVPPPAPAAPAPAAMPAAPLPLASPAPSPSRKLALGALILAAVVLPIVVLVVVLRHGSSSSAADTAASAGAPVELSSASASAVVAVEPPPAPPPVASASAVADKPASSAPIEPRTPTTIAPPPPATTPPPPATTTTPPPATTTAPPPPTVSNGTLLAVAMGGSCAFSVNGASKGTSTSLKLSLKPGAYTVLCRPSSGASKSKSVTVKSGETAMAAFKL
jgi:serine/threonine-protein kinase